MMLMVMKIEPINSVEEARGDYNSRGGVLLINLLRLHQRECSVLPKNLILYFRICLSNKYKELKYLGGIIQTSVYEKWNTITPMLLKHFSLVKIRG